MSVSDKLGGLTFFWNWSPILLALVVLAIDFGAVNALMYWPERRIHRPRWYSFKYGDTICLPGFVLFGGYALRHMDGHPGRFYAQNWWHIGVFIVTALISIGIEADAVLNQKLYTMEQEKKLSKLWHTIIFPVMAYIMVTGFIPLLVELTFSWTAVVAYLALIGFVGTLVLDKRWFKTYPELARATH